MTTLQLDLTDQELDGIASRIDKLFERKAALPIHALQYRLGEVGRKKIDARAIARALAELTNNQRPRKGKIGTPGPQCFEQGILVSPSTTRGESSRSAERALEVLREIVEGTAGPPTQPLIEKLEQQSLHAELSERDDLNILRPLAKAARFTATTRVLHIPVTPAGPTSIWVSHDLEGIYPDDWRLWRFLIDCVDRDARPLLFARKISPATFPLLKLLTAFGLQYYSFHVAESAAAQIKQTRETIGWFHTADSAYMSQHKVCDQLVKEIVAPTNYDRSTAVQDLIVVGARYGLTNSHQAGAAALHRWATETGVHISNGWSRTTSRWVVFSAYKRRGSTSLLQSDAEIPPKPLDDRDTRPIRELSAPVTTRPQPEAEKEPERGFGRKTQRIRVPLVLRRLP